ncbi:MAG: aspartate aminotransferase family protein [Gammaproteobacteria bacterium]|nr:aspartate aminotransferase family protein [Gammaproteobacteria bacterium]
MKDLSRSYTNGSEQPSTKQEFLNVPSPATQPSSDKLSQRELFDIADRVLPGSGLGSYSLADDIRLIYTHGEGSRMWDVDGNEYIDYVGGAGALILGHSHPSVVKAAQTQFERGAHMFGSLNDVAIQLAERLVEDIPCAERIAYATTGSEATAYAMRLARAFTGRNKILKFEGAYHGNHDYAIVSTFPKEPGSYPQGTADSYGQPDATVSTMLVCPYNDLNKLREIVAEHHSDVAAIFAEPVQRIIPAQPGFLQEIRQICDEYDILFILDEVVTGFRLGYGGAQQWFDVKPDLSTHGKVVGGGGPLSCVAGRADVISLSDPKLKGQQGYTYFNGTLHGNPVAAAATMAMLDELGKPGVYERMNSLADDLCKETQKLLDQHNIPAIAEHTGSLWQILFMDKTPCNQADILASDQVAMRKLDTLLMKQGQYILPGVRRFVSTVHTARDLEETLRGLDIACREFNRS